MASTSVPPSLSPSPPSLPPSVPPSVPPSLPSAHFRTSRLPDLDACSVPLGTGSSGIAKAASISRQLDLSQYRPGVVGAGVGEMLANEGAIYSARGA